MNFPTTLTSIAAQAFTYSGLEEAILPASLKWTSATGGSFGIFTQAYNLKRVVINSSTTCIPTHFCRLCTSLTSVNIPSSVIEIGESAFSGCSSLTNVSIPNKVTTIHNNAFSSCDLREVVLPNTVTRIGQVAFSGNTNLTSITLSNKLQSIEYNAFSGCTSLTEIIIPSTVTTIGNVAFSGCTKLKTITVSATTPPTLGGTGVFTNVPIETIYIPAGTRAAYEAATNWSAFVGKFVEMPSFQPDEEDAPMIPVF